MAIIKTGLFNHPEPRFREMVLPVRDYVNLLFPAQQRPDGTLFVHKLEGLPEDARIEGVKFDEMDMTMCFRVWSSTFSPVEPCTCYDRLSVRVTVRQYKPLQGDDRVLVEEGHNNLMVATWKSIELHPKLTAMRDMVCSHPGCPPDKCRHTEVIDAEIVVRPVHYAWAGLFTNKTACCNPTPDGEIVVGYYNKVTCQKCLKELQPYLKEIKQFEAVALEKESGVRVDAKPLESELKRATVLETRVHYGTPGTVTVPCGVRIYHKSLLAVDRAKVTCPKCLAYMKDNGIRAPRQDFKITNTQEGQAETTESVTTVFNKNIALIHYGAKNNPWCGFYPAEEKAAPGAVTLDWAKVNCLECLHRKKLADQQ